MGYYWGMDRLVYPGTTVMSNWKANSNLQFTGYYLAPAPARPTSTWMGVNARPALAAMGWGFIPLYVGHQANRTDHIGKFTTEQAEIDAREAIADAQAKGFPAGTYIYFDVEQGGTLSSEYILYVMNWCGYLKNLSSYIPSVYCSYKDTADQFKNMVSGMGGRIYCFRIGTYTGNSGVDSAPNPADCSVDYASIWQLEQDVTKTFGDYTLVVDMNSSLYKDPSR